MAVVVSHAMRRLPSSPTDNSYSSYRFRGEDHRSNSPSGGTSPGQSALSRSMRYADPWLYSSGSGTVRAPPTGLVFAPAFALCSCPDYINGTKRSKKQSSSGTCKKCKGARLPLAQLDSSSRKFGTVRCYPTYTSTPLSPAGGGTVRVTASPRRPSILPAVTDPYDMVRRSRLDGGGTSNGNTHFNSTTASPKRGKSKNDGGGNNSKSNKTETLNSTIGRRSILECDINPYELVSSDDSKLVESSITLVNGQRIRVRPSLLELEYEDVQVRKSPKMQSSSKSLIPTMKERKPEPVQTKSSAKPKSPASSSKITESDPELTNRFKSILKKSSAFSDTDSENQERSLSPTVQRGGSQFYLPMPTPVRKKVQFLVETDKKSKIVNCVQEKQAIEDSSGDDDVFEDAVSSLPIDEVKSTASENDSKAEKKPVKLHRSFSDRIAQEQKKVVFLDTMALRQRKSKTDLKIDFSDLERLDGTTSRLRKISPTKLRPTRPPPPPPVNGDERKVSRETNFTIFDDKDVDTKLPGNDMILIDNKDEKVSGKNNDNRNTNYKMEQKQETKGSQSYGNFRNTKYPESNDDYDSISSNKIENKKIKVENNIEINELIMKKESMCDISNDIQKKINITVDNIIKDIHNFKLATPNNDSVTKEFEVTDDIETNEEDIKEKHESEKVSEHSKKTQISTETIEGPKLEKINTILPDEKVALEKLDKCLKDEEYAEKLFQEVPPSAPPRKKSNNKVPQIKIANGYTKVIETSAIQSVRIEAPIAPISDFSNKTIVQINPTVPVHKIQIKNEFSDTNNIRTLSVIDSPQRKTSILINGDDCYSTVNVNDDVPLYQSSVVVNEQSPIKCTKKSSTVYITGAFVTTHDQPESQEVTNGHAEDKDPKISLVDTFNEENIPSSDMLRELLKDPVEAVRRNLVPHVCGKADVSRRPREKKLFDNALRSLTGDCIKNGTHLLEESFLRSYESIGDDISSEHSSSTQYEPMDPGSDCYTDNSNRSSITEEELVQRTKFYELLADSALVEVSENEDHHYESIKVDNDPIYEEIEVPPPLPSNPPPTSLLDDLNLDKEFTTRSIFEGASKYDILSYLVDAKERGIVQEDTYSYSFVNNAGTIEEDPKEAYNRVSQMSTVSDSSEDNSLIISGALIDEKATFQKPAEIERNDSGVGSETSKSSLSKYRTKQEVSIICEDCEITLESRSENEPLICRKCIKKRSERKEIVTEIVETEEKYSRDLQIILEEFYQPMLVAGLLTPEQLSAIFLNVEELLENSQALAERLRDAVEIALEQGDDDLLTVNMGKLFLEATPMLHAFETYCVRQGAASLLLASLEKDKELLRIFLRVSQMENTMLRRMNLNSFLMVPVQRVTKYPLLLARLYKVTPSHLDHREELKEAQHKIELHLNHMNSETKDVPSKLWRRIGSSSGRRSSAEMDLVNIKLRKIAVDVLEWNHEEAKFILEGKLLFTQPTDNNWRKGRTIKLSPVNALLVTNGNPPTNKSGDRSEDNSLIFARNGAREAALLLVRDKNGRYSLLREPLYLDRCVIAADPSWQSYFEVQELLGKDTFIFKAEDEEQTQLWYKHLQLHAQGMGAWRKRRNALANIMINGMGLRS